MSLSKNTSIYRGYSIVTVANKVRPAHTDRQDLRDRRQDAKSVRKLARKEAFDAFELTPPETNRDEERFEKLGLPGFASFTKALRHDPVNGLVDPKSFDSLLAAIDAGTQKAFETVQLGGKRA